LTVLDLGGPSRLDVADEGGLECAGIEEFGSDPEPLALTVRIKKVKNMEKYCLCIVVTPPSQDRDEEGETEGHEELVLELIPCVVGLGVHLIRCLKR
jgi:hypothetical protein